MQKVICAVLILFSVFINVSVANATVYQWVGNGHYYEYTNTSSRLYWEDAKILAEVKGGYLATLTSAEEDHWINSTLGQSQYLRAWLGGYQPLESVEPSGGWRWVTGELWDYTHWYAPNNEPNNYIFNDPNGESVLQLGRFIDQPDAWNDFDPHQINSGASAITGYITEWNSYPTVTPEPASLILFGVGSIVMMGCKRMKKAA